MNVINIIKDENIIVNISNEKENSLTKYLINRFEYIFSLFVSIYKFKKNYVCKDKENSKRNNIHHSIINIFST